jgi:hypothetical protein
VLDFLPEKVVIIMPRVFVAFDTVTAFIVNLNAAGKKIDSIFFDNDGYKILTKTPDYHSVIMSKTQVFGGYYSSYIPKSVKVVYVLFRLFLQKNFCIITVGNFTVVDNLFIKILKYVSKYRGEFYVIPNYNTPIPSSYHVEYYVKALNDKNKRKILGKPTGVFDAYKSKEYLGNILSYSSVEDKRLDILGYPSRRKYIGYVKESKEWKDFINSFDVWRSPILRNADEVAVIVTKRPIVPYFFSIEKEANDILEESISAIREIDKDIPIIIKAKAFKTKSLNDWLNFSLAKIIDNNIYVDYTPLPFLSVKAKFAIFNGASSGYYDFLIANKPCIEFCRYSDDYYNIHPNGSYLKKYNIQSSGRKSELVDFISNVYINK